MVHGHGGSWAGATMAPEGKDHIKGQACLGCKRNSLRPLTLTGKLYEPFARADGGRASRLDLLRLSIAAITLMQHGLRSVVEFTLQLVQVALPKGGMIPEDFGEGGQLTAIDLGLNRP